MKETKGEPDALDKFSRLYSQACCQNTPSCFSFLALTHCRGVCKDFRWFELACPEGPRLSVLRPSLKIVTNFKTEKSAQRGSFWDGYPADIRGSFARICRPKTSVMVLEVLSKQAFGRGHPSPEGVDVHDPKGLPIISVRKTLSRIFVPQNSARLIAILVADFGWLIAIAD